MKQDYSYAGEKRDNEKQKLRYIDSGYKPAKYQEPGQFLCHDIDDDKDDRGKKSYRFFYKGERKGFYENGVVENGKNDSVAIDQWPVKWGVEEIVIYDIEASANHSDECIPPPLMVCLEKPLPEKKQKKIGNPGPKSKLIKLSKTFPAFIYHALSRLLMLFA
jgi:hypothetical protein